MREDRLDEIQRALRDEGLDAWLFCDFRGSDPIGRRILGVEDGLATRRWFYYIPATGAPRALVSAVEPGVLDALPGDRHVYRTWQELHASLGTLVAGTRRVAMQYSPNNDVPYVARVDAGTVELVRACGVEVCSAADLVQRFEAVWSSAQYASHCRAAAHVRAVVDAAFGEIGRRARARTACCEGDVQRFILDQFAARGLVTRDPPIVAVGPHSADPHYQAPAGGGASIGLGDFVLIDLWAKEPDGVYADITWTGYVGSHGAGALRAGVRDRISRARRGRGRRAARRGRRCGAAWLRHRCGGARGGEHGRVRRALRASHRAFDWCRGAWQWRQHRWLRNARHAAHLAGHLLFDRARHLLARRVWRAQ